MSSGGISVRSRRAGLVSLVSTILVVAGAGACGGASRSRDGAGAGARGGAAGETTGGSSGEAGSDSETGGSAGSNGGGGGSSGTAGSGTGGGDAGAGGEPDQAPPTIVATSPVHGETGVRKDVDIVVTFSEAMNRASAEAAFRSRRLDASAVTFRWNEAGNALTVDPNVDLEYWVGDIGFPPLDYAFWFEGVVTDVAGNPLLTSTTVPATVAFTTLREVTLRATPLGELDAHCSTFECVDAVGVMSVGDSGDDRAYEGFLSFDLAMLPDVLEPNFVQTATLRVYQSQAFGADGVGLVFGAGPNRLGDVILDHVDYGSAFDTSDYGVTALASLGVFSSSGESGWRSADVTAAFRDDFASSSRDSRSQFRLRFTIPTNENGEADMAQFNTAESMVYPPELEILALVP